MRRSVRFALITALLFLVVIIAPVSAAVITESPDVVPRGGQITVSVHDLPDGASFSLQIEGKFNTAPGQAFAFETHQFAMPFSLGQGVVSATTQNTRITTFDVEKGDTQVTKSGSADSSGFYSISQDYAISSGVFDHMILRGIARSDATQIMTTLNLLGIKQGPSDSQITFTVDGIDNGEIRLIAFVNGAQVMYKTVTVGTGTGTPAPTTAIPTTTATTVVTTTAQTTGTVTSTTTTVLPTGSVTATATTGTTATATTTVPGTNPTATASATAIPIMTFSSADRKVTLRTQGVDYAALLMVSETKVPDSWLMVSRAYTIAPDSLTFSPHATISFVTPASANDYAYFIGRRLTSDWVAVSSTAGTGTIDGEVDLAGTYALMAFRPESTIQPTVTGTAQATTPTPLVTVTTKPKIASIAQASSSPNAAPTRTPLDIMVVAGALAIGVALFARARR